MAKQKHRITVYIDEDVFAWYSGLDEMSRSRLVNETLRQAVLGSPQMTELEKRIAELEKARLASPIVEPQTIAAVATKQLQPAKPVTRPVGRPPKLEAACEAAKARGYLYNEAGKMICETEADFEHWWYLFKNNPLMPETIQVQPNDMVNLVKKNSGTFSTIEELAELWNAHVAKQNALIAKREAIEKSKVTSAPVSGKQVEDDGYDWGEPIPE